MPFSRAWAWTSDLEGIDSNHPKDRGGLTRFGISQRRYPDLDIAKLTFEGATWLFWRDFWKTPGFERLAKANAALEVFAFKAFDFGVTSGPATAIKALQRGVNVLNHGTRAAVLLDDGKLGPLTIGAVLKEVNRRGKDPLLAQLCGRQWDHYERIAVQDSTQRAFTPGWGVRAMALPPGHVIRD